MLGLNALSGIGGVWTQAIAEATVQAVIGLNALSGIGGVWTMSEGGHVYLGVVILSLNALSGIGGVWTRRQERGPHHAQ